MTDHLDPFRPPPDPTDGPPYTHTFPAQGPWVECDSCGGSGIRDGEDCGQCHGDGGWEKPLPPPCYTITDVTEDKAGQK